MYFWLYSLLIHIRLIVITCGNGELQKVVRRVRAADSALAAGNFVRGAQGTETSSSPEKEETFCPSSNLERRKTYVLSFYDHLRALKNCRVEQIEKLWYSPKLQNRWVQVQICLKASSQGCAVVKCFARFRPSLCIWNDDLILRIPPSNPPTLWGSDKIRSNLKFEIS